MNTTIKNDNKLNKLIYIYKIEGFFWKAFLSGLKKGYKTNCKQTNKITYHHEY